MTTMHIWLVLVLPTVIVARGHALRYRAWRAELRRREHAARQAERAQRRLKAEAWGFGLSEPSSLSTHYASSLGSSRSASLGGEAEAEAEEVKMVLAAALPPQLLQRGLQRAARRRRRRPHHPADWQHVAASRALRAFGAAHGLCIVALLLAPPLYAWHRQAFR